MSAEVTRCFGHLIPADSRWTRNCMNKATDWSRRPWKQVHCWMSGTRVAALGGMLSAAKDVPLYLLRGGARFSAQLADAEFKNAFCDLGKDLFNSLRSFAATITIAAALILSIPVGSKIFRLFESHPHILKSLKEQIAELKTNLEAADLGLQTAFREMTAAERKAANDIKQLKDSLAILERQIELKDTKIEELGVTIEELRKNLDNFVNDTATLTNENSTLKKTIEDLKKTIENLKNPATAATDTQKEVQELTNEQITGILNKGISVGREVLSTEKTQINNLKLLKEFCTKILADNSDLPLSDAERKYFSDLKADLEEAITLGSQLISELEPLIASGDFDSKTILKLLIKHSAYYEVFNSKLFKYYTQNLDIYETKPQLGDNDFYPQLTRKFDQFMASKGLFNDYSSVLITLIQRLPRIEMLAIELNKNSLVNCEKEKQHLIAIAKKTNESARQFEKGERGAFQLSLLFEKYRSMNALKFQFDKTLTTIFKESKYISLNSFHILGEQIEESQRNDWNKFCEYFTPKIYPSYDYVQSIVGDTNEETGALQLEALLIHYISKAGKLEKDEADALKAILEKCPHINPSTFDHEIIDGYKFGANASLVDDFRLKFRSDLVTPAYLNSIKADSDSRKGALQLEEILKVYLASSKKDKDVRKLVTFIRSCPAIKPKSFYDKEINKYDVGSNANHIKAFREQFMPLLISEEFVVNIQAETKEKKAVLQLEALLSYFLIKQGRLNEKETHDFLKAFDNCSDITVSTFFDAYFDKYTIGNNNTSVREFRNHMIGRLLAIQERIAKTATQADANEKLSLANEKLEGLNNIPRKHLKGLDHKKHLQRLEEIQNSYQKHVRTR